MRAVLIVAMIAVAGIAALVVWNEREEDKDGEPRELVPPPETAEPLPRGWTKSANAVLGFVLGAPPGWSAKATSARTTLKSPGSAAVVSVTADRSEQALQVGLAEYARGVAERLTGGAVAVEIEIAVLPASGYEVARTRPKRTGRERLQVLVVRRPELAAYPLLVASDRSAKPAVLAPLVAGIVRSLRERPVAAPGA